MMILQKLTVGMQRFMLEAFLDLRELRMHLPENRGLSEL